MTRRVCAVQGKYGVVLHIQSVVRSRTEGRSRSHRTAGTRRPQSHSHLLAVIQECLRYRNLGLARCLAIYAAPCINTSSFLACGTCSHPCVRHFYAEPQAARICILRLSWVPCHETTLSAVWYLREYQSGGAILGRDSAVAGCGRARRSFRSYVTGPVNEPLALEES